MKSTKPRQVNLTRPKLNRARGKLSYEGDVGDVGDVGDMIGANSFIELAVSIRHATALRLLAPHHKDPFDRMLVAQALVEECTLVTSDSFLGVYGVPILDARL